ncbi:MAG TPA: SagB family peptide dehydrogenase [Desulfosporosinus sp.]|nr:SagB family peptide dehydrogenase [Desulfosporosinus sp.]
MPSIILSLRNGVSILEPSEGGLELRGGYRSHRIKDVTPNTIQTLLRLFSNEISYAELLDRRGNGDEPGGVWSCLENISRLGCLSWSIEAQGLEIAKLQTIGLGFAPHLTQIGRDQRFVASRFAYSRSLNRKSVLETPLNPVRIELSNWLSGAVWQQISQPCTYPELSAVIPGSDPELVRMLLQLLLAAGVIQPLDDSAVASGALDEALKQWEFHDLLFHSRSRAGRHDQPLGDAFPFWPKIPPLPAFKQPFRGEVLELYKPDMEQLSGEDYPFTLILEERRSILDYGPQSITLQQIGEFLYRTARAKRIKPINEQMGVMYETSTRPYPGVGNCYELEIYLTVAECAGLNNGLYHFDPQHHTLTKVCGENQHTVLILKQAAHVADISCNPQVVITLTARFSRVAWKYSSIAYSLILKDVGVLFQTMYLVATAMDLSPCALDSGHADLLCKAAGLDYWQESAVGEFMLASKRIG